MNSQIEKYLKQKHIEPKNIKIYEAALTHSSYKNEHTYDEDYEKLEFIGDAILEFVTTKLIYEYRPELDQGLMTKLRASIVQSSSLAAYARDDKIYNLIRAGNSISKDDLKKSDKYLEDVFEALIGAIWLDTGLDNAEKFITNFILKDVQILEVNHLTDYKSKLQEIMQLEYKENVFYDTFLINDKQIFKSNAYVKIEDKTIYLASGIGTSKKEAEKNAAKEYLQKEGYVNE